jgi:hypothetical protein
VSESAELRESLKEVDRKLNEAKEWAKGEKFAVSIAGSREVISNLEAGREGHLRYH